MTILSYEELIFICFFSLNFVFLNGGPLAAKKEINFFFEKLCLVLFVSANLLFQHLFHVIWMGFDMVGERFVGFILEITEDTTESSHDMCVLSMSGHCAITDGSE